MVDDVEEELNELKVNLEKGLNWLNQQFGREVKKVKHTLKKKGVDLDLLEEEVGDLAWQTKDGIESYLMAVEGKERPLDEKLAKEFHDTFYSVRSEITKILKDPSKLLTDTQETLKGLSHTIIKAFSSLGKMFNNLFSQESKKPTFTPGHKKLPQHLSAKESSFHAHMMSPKKNTPPTHTNLGGMRGKGKT